ncbi:PPOX class F420-dependent oxidoreductase [Nonomuraea sp. PA05]|uniref:PPOX class F420-dependent oxidoreductase n=1 Tax=Nonomuraea sp. PA05 TaxID=2604466 RepID=UPI0021CCC5DC|nr:PPOX class F420-dependent oxidoreductase [Nonomuraea sp. PA05]
MNLGAEQYLSVTTYRKDGTPVATPVWVVQDGDAVAIWTTAGSGKVKRIRNNPDVRVAGCDVRGKVSTEPVRGRAEILDAAETARVRGLLRRKYGVMGRLVLLGSRLRRGDAGTVAVRITAV